MTAPASDRDVAQALAVGLVGVSAFRWGWAELESALAPPSLPLVTLTRLQADAGAVADMCRPNRIDAAITLESHAWAGGYEDARALQDTVRALVYATGWNLQAEQDAYDGVLRAWRISAQWMQVAGLTVTAPAPIPPPEPPPGGGDESMALFIPLHFYFAPEPPPVRAFSDGFDGGFA